MIFCYFPLFHTFLIKKYAKSCFRVKKLISTSQRRAEHPFAGQNTQQYTDKPVSFFICFSKYLCQKHKNLYFSFCFKVVGKSEDERYDFERQKRRLFSKLNQNKNTYNDDGDEEEQENQAQGIRSELEALRSSGQVKGLFR